MSFGEVIIFLIAFVDYWSTALSKKPLFGNHDSERRVAGVVLCVNKTVAEANQRSFGKANACVLAFNASSSGNKFLLIQNFLKPLECTFIILSLRERLGKMNEVWEISVLCLRGMSAI